VADAFVQWNGGSTLKAGDLLVDVQGAHFPLHAAVKSSCSNADAMRSISVKIFPFSGHLIGVALVLLLTRLQSPGGIKVWFRRTPISGLLFGGLIAALLMLAIDYSVLSFPGLPPVVFSRFSHLA
jgi:hypothetical protein